MADLLPSIPDASASEDAEPRVVGVDEEAADEVFGALSSATARELYAALTEDPAHPSALADRVDTSLQNAQYHIEKLENADLIEVVDTAYSEKGREMDVYAPADAPLVVFAGDRDDQSLLSQALGRLLGGFGLLSAASVVAEGLFGEDEAGGRPGFFTGGDDAAEFESADADATDGGAGDDTAGGADDAADADTVRTEETDAEFAREPADPLVDAVGTVADDVAWIGDLLHATGLSPGAAVLVLGGALLVVGVAGWYGWKRQTRV